MVNSSSNENNKNEASKIKRNRECQYCGVFCPESDTTRIPSDPGQLSAWIEILGPEFAENIKNSKCGAICLNHIENEERGPYRLPKNTHNINLVNSKPKVKKVRKCKTYDYSKCRYCGVSNAKSNMTSIPRNPEQLLKWIEILGQQFAKNIKQFKTNNICLNHIENGARRSRYRLPKKMDDIPNMTTSDGDDEEEVEEVKAPKEIEKKNKRTSERLAKRERIDYTFGIDEDEEDEEEGFEEQNQETEDGDEEYEEMESIGPISEVLGFETINIKIQNHSNSTVVKLETEDQDDDCVEMVPPKYEGVVVKVRTTNNLTQTDVKMDDDLIQCRVCDGYFNKNSMTVAPSDPEEMKKWVNVLGSQFFGNIMQNSPPYFICLTHLRMMVDTVFQREKPTEL